MIFGEIAKSEEFSQKLWAKQPFKLGANLDVAVGAFGMSDLKKHAHDYPYFYAGIGTLVDGGGWMMAKFDKTAQLQGRADCMQVCPFSSPVHQPLCATFPLMPSLHFALGRLWFLI